MMQFNLFVFHSVPEFVHLETGENLPCFLSSNDASYFKHWCRCLKVLFLTLAVMRETALGSGSVLGMLLQSCHIKLQTQQQDIKGEKRLKVH